MALLERSVAPPPPLTCAAASSSSTQKQKQKQHVCQRGRRESGRLRRASLPATLLYGRSHVSVSPGVQGELSYPTHASRGGRATRRCERTVQWGEEEEEPARTHCSLLAASLRPREGRAAAGRSLLFFDGQDLTTTASTTMPAGAGDACGAVTQQGSATSGYRRRPTVVDTERIIAASPIQMKMTWGFGNSLDG